MHIKCINGHHQLFPHPQTSKYFLATEVHSLGKEIYLIGQKLFSVTSKDILSISLLFRNNLQTVIQVHWPLNSGVPLTCSWGCAEVIQEKESYINRSGKVETEMQKAKGRKFGR